MSYAKYNEDNVSIYINRLNDKTSHPNSNILESKKEICEELKKGENKMSENYMYDMPKTLPVILLLDNSGSMAGNDKIDILNNSVNTMLQSFRELDSVIATISVSIITFGYEAKKVSELLPANETQDIKLTANGGTPFGRALQIAKEMIEDKENFPSRSYRPAVIAVSDGLPNDSWEAPLEAFKNTGRSSKCQCMAMSIGAPEGTEAFDVLARFAGGNENVYFADSSKDIFRFFKFVTATIKTRTESSNPNIVPQLDIASIPDEGEDDDILY